MLPRPQAVWRGYAGRPEPAFFPDRPEWFARLPNARVTEPALRQLAYRHPACAVAALIRDYTGLADALEGALVGSGEATYHFLGWAADAGIDLRQPQRFYRDILRRDGCWGLRHAVRTNDRSFGREVEEWAAEHRGANASGAALFLIRRPQEPVRPYEELLHSNPFYLYHALPQLAHRGLRPAASDGADPKWAFHFAASEFSRRHADFERLTWRDPGWATELLWVRSQGRIAPADAAGLAVRLREHAGDHRMLRPATAFLGRIASPAPAAPAPLDAGRAAEAQSLDALRRAKNRAVWRPTPEQIASEAFRRIVGPPQYTELGRPRGTVLDAVGDELAEIKSGVSELRPSYQLRLQAFRAFDEKRKLHLYTSRPISPQLAAWLGPLGVEVDPLP